MKTEKSLHTNLVFSQFHMLEDNKAFHRHSCFHFGGAAIRHRLARPL